jgi:hypothetical protein
MLENPMISQEQSHVSCAFCVRIGTMLLIGALFILSRGFFRPLFVAFAVSLVFAKHKFSSRNWDSKRAF